MRYATLTRITLLLLPALLLVAACDDDDPTSPAPPLWQVIDLELSPGDSRVVAVDFTADFGAAMGLILDGGPNLGHTHEFFGLAADGSWVKGSSDVVRPAMVALDFTLDTTSEWVLAGFQQPGPPSVVLDRRGAEPEYIEQASLGMLTVDGEGSFMVAGGRSGGGGLWTSTAPGDWSFDDLPLTGTNDSGFTDVDIRGNRAVACGYDDGADTKQVMLSRTETTGWTKIDAGGPYTATYYCIALSAEGTIFVGGIEGAGGMDPKAFLSQRTADGQWTDLVLPDPERLHGVMDILIADDGDIYLACMGEGDDTEANLVRACSCGVKKEITPFLGGLLQIDQASNGDIYAVGFRRDEGDGTETGVMLVKSP